MFFYNLQEEGLIETNVLLEEEDPKSEVLTITLIHIAFLNLHKILFRRSDCEQHLKM